MAFIYGKTGIEKHAGVTCGVPHIENVIHENMPSNRYVVVRPIASSLQFDLPGNSTHPLHEVCCVFVVILFRSERHAGTG